MEYITKQEIKTINKWISSTKILFIIGNKGIGKSYLACDIYKKYDINYTQINASNLKDVDIYERITKTIFTKNIFMMINKKMKKGLLIDDIYAFKTHDKKNHSKIINIIEKEKKIECKIIICVDSEYNTNKINKLLEENYIIRLNYSIDTCKDIIKKSFSNIDDNLLINMLKNKKKNIYSTISELSFNRDNYIKTNYDIFNYDNIYNQVINNYNTLYLNIVDNIHEIIDNNWGDYNEIIVKIYKNIFLCDYLESYSILNKNTINYIIFLGIYVSNIYIKLYSKTNVNINDIKYNKYLSYSIHYIHSKKLFNNYFESYAKSIKIYNLIHMLFEYNNKKILSDTIINLINTNNINIQNIDFLLNNYNYLYKKKYRKKTLMNIIKRFLNNL